MNKVIVYDIETIPLSDARLDLLEPEHEAPGNLKDPVKIAAAIAEKKAGWREKAALSPITGRVAMIGFAGAHGLANSMLELAGGPTDDGLDMQERILIESFWTTVKRYIGQGFLIVSWNGHGFDVPFLIKRSWALGIPIPPEVDVMGRWGLQAPWVDLMKVFALGDRANPYTKLETVAGFFGLGSKAGDCTQLRHQLEHEPEAAVAYLQQDLNLTLRIARRMGIAAGADGKEAA